ncbi:MAG: sigma-70 family RNA polymerase sigma factor [Gammaproteobacteria bacterium]
MPCETESNHPERWLDEHGDALYAYALLRVREPAAAEDLVQDALIAGWLARGEYRGGAELRTWLIGILKHKIIDHLRKAGREVRLEMPEESEDPMLHKFDDTGHWLTAPVEFRDPSAILENDELRHALLNCIDKLPSALRQAFVLREFDGLDTPTLIATLGLSGANNLWVMLSRAREKLRACLEGYWRT